MEEARTYLRQAFVLPDDLDHLCVNPQDAGRFVNHSANPNLGFNTTLRQIEVGEELVMDYRFHGDPEWYQKICAEYRVLMLGRRKEHGVGGMSSHPQETEVAYHCDHSEYHVAFFGQACERAVG